MPPNAKRATRSARPRGRANKSPLRGITLDSFVGSEFLPFETRINEVSLQPGDKLNWSLNDLHVPQLWKESKGRGVRVAVLDSGIAEGHVDLAGAITSARDFTRSTIGVYDRMGHGTHLAGIVGARENGFGVIGVAPECEILVAKVTNDSGQILLEPVVEAIKWATDSGAHVLSISFGQPTGHPRLYEAILNAINSGVAVICAAGNTGPFMNSVMYPAAYLEVIAVGSFGAGGIVAPSSARGRELDLLAPGENIWSTYPPQHYAMLSGTSMSAPFTAGVAALALSKHAQFPSNTPINNHVALLQHLTGTAIDAGAPGFDWDYGFGLINPASVV